MAMDLMTPEGQAAAERLARQIPTGDRVLLDDDELDEDLDGDEDLDPAEFLVRYDAALARVVETRRLMNNQKEHYKTAKLDHEMALLALQQLRKDKDRNENEPRQLPLRRG